MWPRKQSTWPHFIIDFLHEAIWFLRDYFCCWVHFFLLFAKQHIHIYPQNKAQVEAEWILNVRVSMRVLSNIHLKSLHIVSATRDREIVWNQWRVWQSAHCWTNLLFLKATKFSLIFRFSQGENIWSNISFTTLPSAWFILLCKKSKVCLCTLYCSTVLMSHVFLLPWSSTDHWAVWPSQMENIPICFCKLHSAAVISRINSWNLLPLPPSMFEMLPLPWFNDKNTTFFRERLRKWKASSSDEKKIPTFHNSWGCVMFL